MCFYGTLAFFYLIFIYLVMDFIILGIIIVGIVKGWMSGFVKQVVLIVGLIAGLLFARVLYGMVAEWLAPKLGSSATVAQILAFIIIWIAVPTALSLAANILTKALDSINVGWLNRWLGCGLAALKYMLIIGVVINVIEYIDPKGYIISKTKREDSTLYYPIEKFAAIFFPAAKNLLTK